MSSKSRRPALGRSAGAVVALAAAVALVIWARKRGKNGNGASRSAAR